MAGRQGNFKPLQRSVPHDNRGFLWSAHVFHFMTVSSCTSATSTTGGPESKETKQGPKLGFYKHTHTCPRRRRRRKEKFAKIGDTRAAAGLHLIFAAAGNHFCCLFRSVCLIPCFLFFVLAGHLVQHTPFINNQCLSFVPTGKITCPSPESFWGLFSFLSRLQTPNVK